MVVLMLFSPIKFLSTKMSIWVDSEQKEVYVYLSLFPGLPSRAEQAPLAIEQKPIIKGAWSLNSQEGVSVRGLGSSPSHCLAASPHAFIKLSIPSLCPHLSTTTTKTQFITKDCMRSCSQSPILSLQNHRTTLIKSYIQNLIRPLIFTINTWYVLSDSHTPPGHERMNSSQIQNSHQTLNLHATEITAGYERRKKRQNSLFQGTKSRTLVFLE